MREPFRRRKVQCVTPVGLHRMAYLEWGDPDNACVLICVHGLTRCARDFDDLALAMSRDYRVVCPDVPGRGESDWLKNPLEYVMPTYLSDMVTLIARLNAESVHWVGTSMGGLIGMVLASLPQSPITRLVLNDVGPLVTAVSLQRIGSYIGKWPPLASLEAAEQYVRSVSASFGPHSDAQWRFLTEHVVRRKPDGNWRMHYDPDIAVPFNAPGAVDAQGRHRDVDLWPCYDAVCAPTLVLRGEMSDLLTRETSLQMAARGPCAKVVEIEGVGHAPTLIQPDQIAVVRDFLTGSRQG